MARSPPSTTMKLVVRQEISPESRVVVVVVTATILLLLLLVATALC